MVRGRALNFPRPMHPVRSFALHRCRLAFNVSISSLALAACSPSDGASPSANGGSTPGGASSAGSGNAGAPSATGGAGSNGPAAGSPSGGSVAAGGGAAGGGQAGSPASGGQASGLRPFPQHAFGTFCTYPKNPDDASVRSAYQLWKDVTVTADGAGGFLRVKKPDSGAIIGSTASEGIGYGMILAAYMGDQPLFDALWRYEQLHLDAQGLMDWDIGPTGQVSGMGGATDGDIDMAWALIMADRQWGGQGSLDKTYLVYAQDLIDRIWRFEVDHARGEMLMAGDQWGGVDLTNPGRIAQLGQFERIALPTHDRPNNRLTGNAHDVTQHPLQLDVHLLHSLLDMQNMRRAMLDEFSTITHQSTQSSDLRVRAE